MAKIYNEIVIDMNPESHSYMEVLHEDSFEYSKGDMIWLQPDDIYIYAKDKKETRNLSYTTENNISLNVPSSRYELLKWNADTQNFEGTGQYSPWSHKRYQDPQSKRWRVIDNKEYVSEIGKYKMHDTLDVANTDQRRSSKSEWGAADISKEDFYDENGNKLTVDQVMAKLQPKFPDVTPEKLKEQILDFGPQLEEVDKKETGFLAEQYGGGEGEDKVSFGESLAGKAAGISKEADIYGLQKEAGKAGAEARQAFGGGMGAGMRGAFAGQADIAKGFETAYDKYGLAKEKAELGYRKGMYGLEQEAESDFESELQGFIGGLAREGGYVRKDGSGVGNNPESFSTFLTQLPDAGGS